MDFEHGILFFLIGIPVSIAALYVILNNLDSNNERLDDTDSNNSI